MAQRLQGRPPPLPESTSNIGRAIAVALAAEGAHVVVTGRDDQRGGAVVASIRESGGRADYAHADLDGSARACRALAATAAERLGGRIDIPVNNAAIFPPADTLSAAPAVIDRVFAVNVKPPSFLAQAS